jgi:hypothetical protein
MHGLAALPNVGGDHEPGPRRELFEPLDIPQLEQTLERGTVPRQTRAVLAQAADMRSSRQAETLRAAAGEPELQGSDERPEGCTAGDPRGFQL